MGCLSMGDENVYVCMTRVEESQRVDIVSASVHDASACMYRQKALSWISL